MYFLWKQSCLFLFSQPASHLTTSLLESAEIPTIPTIEHCVRFHKSFSHFRVFPSKIFIWLKCSHIRRLRCWPNLPLLRITQSFKPDLYPVNFVFLEAFVVSLKRVILKQLKTCKDLTEVKKRGIYAVVVPFRDAVQIWRLLDQCACRFVKLPEWKRVIVLLNQHQQNVKTWYKTHTYFLPVLISKSFEAFVVTLLQQFPFYHRCLQSS